MKLNHLQKLLRVYSGIYFILMIITPLYVFGTVGMLYFSSVVSDDFSRVVGSGLNLLVSTGVYFLWWKIFPYLANLLEFQLIGSSERKKLLTCLYQLFAAAFVLDILGRLLKSLNIGNSGAYSLNNLTAPRVDATTVENILYWFQLTLKSIDSYGYFLTPTTYGILNLLIAWVFYLFASRDTKG